MKKILFFILLSLCCTLFYPADLYCAGPFYIYPKGKGVYGARIWENGTIRWVYDEGQLSDAIPNQPRDGKKELCLNRKDDVDFLCKDNLSQCGVVMCVDVLFKRWADAHLLLGDGSPVSTAGINVINGGPAGKDVTKDNFSLENGYKDNLPSGTVLIIFDDKGEILKAGNNSDKLGLTQLFYKENLPYYTGGWLVLNGLLASDANFAVTILHELGHLLGVDHSQPLLDVFGGNSQNVKENAGITTMYPYLLKGAAGGAQLDLHVDDVISLSMLYPSADFVSKFCRIEGDLLDAAKKPYQGINVIAYSSGGDKFVDSRSFVSGALYPPCADSGSYGRYVLPGLKPGVPYRVVYEPVFSDLRNFANGLNPYNEYICNMQPGADEKGVILIGGKELQACDASIAGLDSKYMSSTGLLLSYSTGVSTDSVNISKTPSIKADDTSLGSNPGSADGAEDDGDGKKKGWCMSIAGGVDPAAGVIFPLLFVILYFIRKRLAGCA